MRGLGVGQDKGTGPIRPKSLSAHRFLRDSQKKGGPAWLAGLWVLLWVLAGSPHRGSPYCTGGI